MKKHLVQRWFLLALAGVLALGFGLPNEIAPLIAEVPRGGIVATVLFLMSVTLDAHAVRRALSRPRPVILATAINFGLVPLVAWVAVIALRSGQLIREDLLIGLLIAGAVPSTLASAAVWTRRAGGNDAVSLMVTMITNLACFVVTPLWLFWTTGTSTDIELLPMIRRLALLVVLPMALGQILRAIRPIGRWASSQKTTLGVFAQCGVLSMILIGAVEAGTELTPGAVRLIDWTLMLGAVATIHLVTLWSGHALAAAVGIAREERIAVGFSGSQKTLMVGLDLALTYFAPQPLAMLPMVAYHVVQLLLDTAVANRLRAKTPTSASP
jgi:sodium/bile acid cotransporter 7